MNNTPENIAMNKADGGIDVFDLIQYTTDKIGRTNYIKFGRIWLPVDSNRGKVRFFALPLSGINGECVADIVLREDYRPKGDNQ